MTERAPVDPEAYRVQAAFSGEWRDLWWNADFLALMAHRWRLSEVRSVLDVGCGVGHWGQRLADVLPDDATLVGVDREPSFVASAEQRAKERGLAERFSYRVGTAEALPVGEERFDLVTCQTVLMHVADARVAVAEAARVLAPGGLLVAAEPNQLASMLALASASPRLSIEDTLALVELHLTCIRGKELEGDGDSNVGDVLPGLFAEAGLVDVQVFQNDRCATWLPPYQTAAARIDVAQQLEWIRQEVWATGIEPDSRARFVAGGGATARFEELWATAMRVQQQLVADVEGGDYHAARGFVMYVTSARAPH